jgi:hypothetical protein
MTKSGVIFSSFVLRICFVIRHFDRRITRSMRKEKAYAAAGVDVRLRLGGVMGYATGSI